MDGGACVRRTRAWLRSDRQLTTTRHQSTPVFTRETYRWYYNIVLLNAVHLTPSSPYYGYVSNMMAALSRKEDRAQFTDTVKTIGQWNARYCKHLDLPTGATDDVIFSKLTKVCV